MISDKRQQQLVRMWARLSTEQLAEWIERQPDKEELYALLIQIEQQNGGRKRINPDN